MSSPIERSLSRPSLGWLAALALSALLAAGCSSDGDDDAEPQQSDIVETPTTIPGAADNVYDGSEDGQELDNLNVPESDADDELDDGQTG